MFLLWAFLYLLLASQYTRVVFESTNWFWMAICTFWVFGKSFPQLRWYTALPSEGRRASRAWIWAASLQPKHTPGPGCEGPHLLVDPKLPPTDKPACLLPICTQRRAVWASSSLDIKHFNIVNLCLSTYPQKNERIGSNQRYGHKMVITSLFLRRKMEADNFNKRVLWSPLLRLLSQSGLLWVMGDSGSPAPGNKALFWQIKEQAEVSCHLLEGAWWALHSPP